MHQVHNAGHQGNRSATYTHTHTHNIHNTHTGTHTRTCSHIHAIIMHNIRLLRMLSTWSWVCQLSRGGSKICQRGQIMASKDCEPIMGVWRQSPIRVQGKGMKPPWSWKLFVHFHTKEGLKVKFVLPRSAPTFGQWGERPPGLPMSGSTRAFVRCFYFSILP